MGRKDIIMMSAEELRRLSMIKQAIGKVITQEKAAEVIEVTERQVRRMVKKVKEEGDTGIIHRLRGKPGNRGIDEEIKDKALELYNKNYWDFGPTLASEKLYELDKIEVNHDTLRCWLIDTDKDKWEWQRRASILTSIAPISQ